MLALLWVIGGVLWLTSVTNHLVWCFMATLMTVVSGWECVCVWGVWRWCVFSEVCNVIYQSPVQILECVTINLTFVYALHAYAHITHLNLSSIIVSYCCKLILNWKVPPTCLFTPTAAYYCVNGFVAIVKIVNLPHTYMYHVLQINHSSHGWSKLRVAVVYIIAWYVRTLKLYFFTLSLLPPHPGSFPPC